MVRRCLLVLPLASLAATTCQDEVFCDMGSSILQKMAAGGRQPPAMEEKGEKKAYTKQDIYHEAIADKESWSQRRRDQSDENSVKLRSNMHASNPFEGGVSTSAEEAKKTPDCEDEDSFATKEERHETNDGEQNDGIEKEQRKGCKFIQTGELVAAEAEPVKYESNGRHGFDWGYAGVGDKIAAAELVAHSVKSKEIGTRAKDAKSNEIKRQDKETFDADDHEAEKADVGNDKSSTEEALREAVKRAVAHSSAASSPVTPFATKTGLGPILDEKESVPPDMETTTRERMHSLEQDRFAAIEIKVKAPEAQKGHEPFRARQSHHWRKSHQHRKSLHYTQLSREIKDGMGPLGMRQPSFRRDDTEMVGAPGAKPCATPVPHGAVAPPVNTGNDDIKLAKSATQDSGVDHDNPCRQADGCLEREKL